MSLFSAPNPLSTVILRTVARVTCPLLVLFSVYLLLRGHRLPGGGFIAGLMTASAIMLVYLAYGYRAVTTMKGPLAHYLVVVGMMAAFATGLGGWFWSASRSFLASAHSKIDVPGADELWGITSAFAFDFGIYLVVVGVTVSIILMLGGEDRPAP